MPYTRDRTDELKHEIALQCARFAGELGADIGEQAASHGLCSPEAFARILEGGRTDIGMTRLVDLMFTLRDRITDLEFGPYDPVEDEPMEDFIGSDGIPF